MTLEFTRAAIADLQSISDYTLETWGSEQEVAYVDSLWVKFEEIASNSQRYRSRDDLFPGCKIAAYSRHVILVRKEDEILQIVRVLHSVMDFKRHIPKNVTKR